MCPVTQNAAGADRGAFTQGLGGTISMSNLVLPHGRKFDRRDFLKVAGAGLAVAALPAAVRAQDPGKLTASAWLPHVRHHAAPFTASHPGIQVGLVNAGHGAPHYAALRAGLQAGSGLPDVAHMEFQFLESFRQVDAFADIGQWANAHKAEFPEGTWTQVAKGDVVNGMPWDSGPMAMLYRKDILDKHGITPPATWAEFADAAKKLHAADPNVFLTDALLSNGGWVNGLLWPMGWKPITRDGDKLAININDKIS